MVRHFSAKQKAAQALFTARAKAGTWKNKRRARPTLAQVKAYDPRVLIVQRRAASSGRAGYSMARRKSYSKKARRHSRKGSSMGGLGGIFKGRGFIGKMIGMGPIGALLGGAIAVEGAKAVAPQMVQTKETKAVAGFLGGGLLGAAVGYFNDQIKAAIPGIMPASTAAGYTSYGY